MIDERDVKYECFAGSGPGGQNRNKCQICVRATHVPTGTVATATSERSLRQNKLNAFENLKAKIQAKVDGWRASQKRKRRDEKPDATFGNAIRIYRLCGKDQSVIDRRVDGTFHINTLKRGELDDLLKEIMKTHITGGR